jgi:hypothetical protein
MGCASGKTIRRVPQDRTRLKAELGQIEKLTGLHSKA